MRTRQRRKRKGEGEKEEDEEERNSDEEVPASLLQQLGERVSHKHFGRHFLSVASLDGLDVALFVVAAAAIKKNLKKWKESQAPAKTEEDSGELGEEAHTQHSPRARRQSTVGRRRKTPRNAPSAYSSQPETATLLAGKIVATAFYEPSTRTRCSFETGALRLGGQILSCSDMTSISSTKKGETLEDTVRMLAAYADAIVLRHPEQGSVARAAAVLGTQAETAEVCCVLNAGDGTGEHPTQALLDLFTIAELFPEWWNEQLQRLTRDQQGENVAAEKGANEETNELKKENNGEEKQQEGDHGMDRPAQQQSVSCTTDEGGAVGGGIDTSGLPQKVDGGEVAEGLVHLSAQSSSSNSEDKAARDTPTTDAENRRLTVAFVGDLKHGRTVHSLALLLSKFDCRIITLSLPDLGLPDSLEDSLRRNFEAQGGDGRERLMHGSNFVETIGAADVLYMTRTQTERFTNPEAGDSFGKQSPNNFILTRTLLETHAKPHVKVLHPLPRVDEIDTTVDTTPFCAYFAQAQNGVYMRMALLAILLNRHTWQVLFGV